MTKIFWNAIFLTKLFWDKIFHPNFFLNQHFFETKHILNQNFQNQNFCGPTIFYLIFFKNIFCHTRLHLGFSAKLRIWQVPTCKMEPRSGNIFCKNRPDPTRPTDRPASLVFKLLYYHLCPTIPMFLHA